MIILNVLLVVLVSLNINKYTPATPEIDSKLQPYVSTFLSYCDTYKVDCSRVAEFSIKFSNFRVAKVYYKLFSEGSLIGLCKPTSNEIEINEEYFNLSSAAEKEQLIIHELGHCILDLEHTEETELDIMNPYSFPEYVYLENYNELMNRFFSCEDFCPEVFFNGENY